MIRTNRVKIVPCLYNSVVLPAAHLGSVQKKKKMRASEDCSASSHRRNSAECVIERWLYIAVIVILVAFYPYAASLPRKP